MIRNSYPTLDFGLGDTADLLRDAVRSFSDDKIAPIADEIEIGRASCRERVCELV